MKARRNLIFSTKQLRQPGDIRRDPPRSLRRDVCDDLFLWMKEPVHDVEFARFNPLNGVG
jgi:hypothetical protein